MDNIDDKNPVSGFVAVYRIMPSTREILSEIGLESKPNIQKVPAVRFQLSGRTSLLDATFPQLCKLKPDT